MHKKNKLRVIVSFILAPLILFVGFLFFGAIALIIAIIVLTIITLIILFYMVSYLNKRFRQFIYNTKYYKTSIKGDKGDTIKRYYKKIKKGEEIVIENVKEHQESSKNL